MYIGGEDVATLSDEFNLCTPFNTPCCTEFLTYARWWGCRYPRSEAWVSAEYRGGLGLCSCR